MRLWKWIIEWYRGLTAKCAYCGASNAKNGVCHRRARIGINYKRIHIGWFATAEEAGKAYEDAAKKFHGEFACTG
jgi:hypothetical protein